MHILSQVKEYQVWLCKGNTVYQYMKHFAEKEEQKNNIQCSLHVYVVKGEFIFLIVPRLRHHQDL